MKVYKLFSFIPILALIAFSFSREAKQDGDKQINSQSANKLLLRTNPQQNAIESGLRLATFDVDATPPVGEHDPSHSWHYKTFSNSWDMGLRAKGIILLGAGKPIVICAIDWGCIGNDAHDAFKSALADAAGTTSERVAVHTLHQHDAPWADFSIERILKESGINPLFFEGSFHREFKRRLATAVGNSIHYSQLLTHLGLGEAQVYKVASNRRILGEDGLVRAGRMSSCRDSALRAEPEGLIDPMVSVISFWNGDKPLAVLSYYAIHPMSYYRTGMPNPDFVGVARFIRQLAVPDALHVYFTGAGGNIAAGKYNDGSKENRLILAERLADGMKRAWEATRLESLAVDEVDWKVESLALPVTEYIEKLDPNQQIVPGIGMKVESIAARLAFQERSKEGKLIDISCLKLGRARILHMPGELFVEYQLAAKATRPDLFVAMAAFGNYGPCYIGTAIAYEQGGYETSVEWSYVTPEVEGVLMTAIRNLLDVK